ncbi:MAG: DEAD/DEAH box helicase family protein [Planctomycetota bacterium]|nr:DEAD/DEAH box helicase family protein [Planctomycetota bacterium]
MDLSPSEWQTRKKKIDPKLAAAGWKVVPYKEGKPLSAYTHHAIEEYPTAHGPADYALVVNGLFLGIVEAKKRAIGPQEVLTQAKRYATGVEESPLDYGGIRVPYLYSTNGELIYFRDVRHELNLSHPVAAFHTPAALEEFMGRDVEAALAWFKANANSHSRLRPYQVEANTAIEKALTKRSQTMLVAMATGTGKTFTMVNQVYRLLRSGYAKRVLFLVDRRALAAQTVRSFAAFEPEPGKKFDQLYEVYSQRFQKEDFEEGEKFDPKVLPNNYLTAPAAKHTFLYVSTIQRMAINLFGRNVITGLGEETIDDDVTKLDIPIHAFDVIIADECHRGYTAQELSVWRDTLDHFDAVKIGLTATPAKHTAAYFKDIVFRYEYQTAVREGHLVDYDAVAIRSEVRMTGVFLKAGETVGVVDTDTGHELLDKLEDERAFDTTEIEKKVTAPESNRKILEEVKRHALEHEQKCGRFPKILIFTVNDTPHTGHADQVVKLCREVFGRGEDFVQKITGRVDRPLQHIREFRNRPNPCIAVTVDLLTTGVDIPDLEYLVFMRPVKSRILWEQMLGRGTRKGERHKDKSHFTVFDCFDGSLFEYFRNASAMDEEPPEKPSRDILEIIEAVWKNEDREYNTKCLSKRLQRIDKEMSGEAREFLATMIPDGDLSKFARELPQALKQDFTGTMKVLRDPRMQNFLVNYPRPKNVFLVGHEVEDAVTSRVLIRDGLGKQYKPEDYLAAFARFVKDNPAHVQAIEILLNRPQDWNTAALSELRQKLAASPEHFTLENLQRAHEVQYHKALADIISMVKHAARTEAPLLTAPERVAAAFARLSASQTFTPDQQRWLSRIREHLVENLSIDKEDFSLPVFERDGGWKPANRIFNGELMSIIKKLNAEIAA